ncbi:helix-turn-helix transcriptional regulator [Gluconobacter cerevisiae]|uniref:Helix-turn-helix transcriptional regulator n=1 Tax=Gluconobacter cerevisiae TaxID=1379734 RepID=A0ABR9YHA2_9PROT|nr:helix-turn-helix transcriptional regulator [Gluconobacter cerevisiae]MBF0877897.1 helix-turn-helix transcriptional regulator [Gluconobacter cerevisiae]
MGAIEHWSSSSGVNSHAHSQHQLLFAIKGVAHVKTSKGSWILPPSRAIWIPGETEHAFRAPRPVKVAIIYIRSDMPCAQKWSGCTVLNVSPLIKELVLVGATLPRTYNIDSAEERLFRVLLDQLAIMPQIPVELPEISDARIKNISDLLRQNPAERRSLEELVKIAGTSIRTAERLFIEETGLTFGQWRLRLRMVIALELLAEEESVGNIAFALGYENPSSFIATFRKFFGKTPARFYEH